MLCWLSCIRLCLMWCKELEYNEVKHCEAFQIELLTFYSHIYIFMYVYKW